MLRAVLMLALVLLAPVAASAQSPVDGTYNTEWAALRDRWAGPILTTGSLVLDVIMTENDGAWWVVEFRNRATGQVECFSHPYWYDEAYIYVQCGNLSAADGGESVAFYGDSTDRPQRAFRIKVSGYEGSDYIERWLVGERQVATAPSITFTAPTANQIVSGTTPIRVTTSGFSTGSRTWVLLVDGVQRQTNTTSSDSFTLWFNTTRVVNGTHTFTVRVTQGSTSASTDVQVTVGN